MNYQLDTQELNLKTDNNNFITITTPGEIQQTFIADQDKLSGIKIFLSNFGKSVRNSNYTLVLYQKDCLSIITTVVLPNTTIDSSYYRAYFPEIKNSNNHTYCLSITPPAKSAFDPLAIQLSKPNIYNQGMLTIRGDPSQQDIVFAPLYDIHK